MGAARDQLFVDLFTTALEGGINYWSHCSAYHWRLDDDAEGRFPDSGEERQDVRGFFATIHDAEEHDKTYRIDRTTILQGYVLATHAWRDKIHWSSGEKPPLVVTDDTDWDFDAGDADCIVQLGLFGEVVYG